jgi:hypothetical protein
MDHSLSGNKTTHTLGFTGAVGQISLGSCGSKQQEYTAADAALLALHLTHREATLLFTMAARRGATDLLISDALREGLPHQSDPDYRQDTSAGLQPENKTALGAIQAHDWSPADRRTIMLT